MNEFYSINDDSRSETYPSGLTQVTAERSILAALIHRPDALWDYPALSAGVFTVPAHQLIFSTLKALVQVGSNADVVAVYDALTSSKQLEAVGGVAELFTLADETHLSHYLLTLVKRALTGLKGASCSTSVPRLQRVWRRKRSTQIGPWSSLRRG